MSGWYDICHAVVDCSMLYSAMLITHSDVVTI